MAPPVDVRRCREVTNGTSSDPTTVASIDLITRDPNIKYLGRIRLGRVRSASVRAAAGIDTSPIQGNGSILSAGHVASHWKRKEMHRSGREEMKQQQPKGGQKPAADRGH